MTKNSLFSKNTVFWSFSIIEKYMFYLCYFFEFFFKLRIFNCSFQKCRWKICCYWYFGWNFRFFQRLSKIDSKKMIGHKSVEFSPKYVFWQIFQIDFWKELLKMHILKKNISMLQELIHVLGDESKLPKFEKNGDFLQKP